MNRKALEIAVTARLRNGRAFVTDGPYAETKEVLGGSFILEARDSSHAIQLTSKHPGVRRGALEVRPIDEEFTARANAGSRREGRLRWSSPQSG